MAEPWYQVGPEQALQAQESGQAGLAESEAGARLLKYGHNVLKGRKRTPLPLVFLQPFLSPLIYVLSSGGLFIAEETRKAIFSKLFSADKWQLANRQRSGNNRKDNSVIKSGRGK